MANELPPIASEKLVVTPSRYADLVMSEDSEYLPLCVYLPEDVTMHLHGSGNVNKEQPIRGMFADCTAESPLASFGLDAALYIALGDDVDRKSWVSNFIDAFEDQIYSELGLTLLSIPTSTTTYFAQLSDNRFVQIDLYNRLKTSKYEGITLSTITLLEYLREIEVEPTDEEINAVSSQKELAADRLTDMKRFLMIWLELHNVAVELYSTKQPDKRRQVKITPPPQSITMPTRELLGGDGEVTFDDIAGYDHVKEKLLDLAHISDYPSVAKNIGLTKSQGVLLYGPEGTGKTSFAKAFASEISAKFIELPVSEIIDMWVGKSARDVDKKMQEIINIAKSGEKIVLFMDEFDSIGADVSKVNSERADAVNRLKSHILNLAENHHNVIIIGATNNIEKVDKALARAGRFEKIEIGYPNESERRQIIALKLSKVVRLAYDMEEKANGLPTLGLSKNINVPELAMKSHGLVGAHFEEMLHQIRRRRLGAYAARIKQNELLGIVEDVQMPPITQEELLAAIRQYTLSLDFN